MGHPAVGALVRGDDGRTQDRDGTGRRLVERGLGFEAKRPGSCRPRVGDAGRCARHADVRPVRLVALNDACWNREKSTGFAKTSLKALP
jgi:hypothetical protein